MSIATKKQEEEEVTQQRFYLKTPANRIYSCGNFQKKQDIHVIFFRIHKSSKFQSRSNFRVNFLQRFDAHIDSQIF